MERAGSKSHQQTQRRRVYARTSYFNDSAENQVRDYYMNVGPTYPDPIGRQLYAEIASIEEQHVTHYESMLDPNQTLLEQWLLHEACEVYNYYSCVESETNPRIASIWQRMLDYELGQLAFVAELFKTHERRDPAEILPETLSAPIPYAPQREFIRDVLRNEINLRTNGTEFVPLHEESALSLRYREQVNRDGSPSQVVAAGYIFMPGTELAYGLDIKHPHVDVTQTQSTQGALP